VALFESAGLVDASRIRLIAGSGVDCSRFMPDPDREAGARLRVLLPARLLWDKGLAEYVHAARLLHAEGRPIDFLLAGDPDPGNPAAVPEADVREWVRQGLVQRLGHVDDMPALLRSVDIVALPSYREGLPKGLLEAAARGGPPGATGGVLGGGLPRGGLERRAGGWGRGGTDVPGCRGGVTPEVDGLLVPVRDGDALARALARLQEDPALRLRLAEAGRGKALARFDERIVVARTLDVYGEFAQWR